MKSCFQCFCFHTAQILSAVKCLCCQLTGFRKTCQKIPKQVGEQIYSWALPRLISNPCWSSTVEAPLCTYIYYISSSMHYALSTMHPNILHINNNTMRAIPNCNMVCVCACVCGMCAAKYATYQSTTMRCVNSPIWTILQYCELPCMDNIAISCVCVCIYLW